MRRETFNAGMQQRPRSGGWISLALSCALAACIPAGLTGAGAPGKPNILFILADNWAYPHAGALGDPTVHTPAFDRVAREGVTFVNAFCPVPSCSPTRSCILTGRAAHQLEDAASLWSAFPRKWKVFPDTLRDAGYDVGFCEKGWSPGNFKDFGWNRNPVGQEYKTFAEFMERRDPMKPFFFWFGSWNPARHKWIAGSGASKGLRADTVRVPPCLPDVPEVRDNILDYYESVERLDHAAGEALALLEQRGELDNTVVIMTGDNGWQMPRGLANCHDTGSRVPLAIRWGSHLMPGRKVEDFISLSDLAPTFLELADLPVWPGMTARSFADALLDKPGRPARDAVFLERERHANVRRGDLSYPVRGIRTGNFLYLRNLRPERWPAGDPEFYFAVGEYGDVDPSPAKDYILQHRDEPVVKPFFELCFAKRPAEELYDLARDPGQIRNVANDPAYAEKKAALGGRLDAWMRATADPRLDPHHDAWDKYPYFGKRKRPG